MATDENEETERKLVKVKGYLATLSPTALKSMLQSLEVSERRGISDPVSQAILDGARELMRKLETQVRRDDIMQRFFFVFAEPFLVEEKLWQKRKGRVCRKSLSKIWTWIIRDVLDDDLEAIRETVNVGSLSEASDITDAVKQFKAGLWPKVSDAIQATGGDDRARQLLIAQLGDDDAFDDLLDLQDISARETEIQRLISGLVEQFEKRDGDINGTPARLLKGYLSKFSQDRLRVGIICFDLVQEKSTLIKIAKQVAGSEDPSTIASSSAGGLVEAFLVETERLCVAAETAIQQRRPVGEIVELIDRFNRYTRVMRSLSILVGHKPWEEWGRANCVQLSDLIKSQCKDVDSLVRSALEVPKKWANVDGPDAYVLESADRAVRILTAADRAIDSLALFEMMTNCKKELERSFGVLTERAFDILRQSSPEDRDAKSAYAESAILLAGAYFGEEYLNVLWRTHRTILGRFEVSSNSAA